MKCKACKFKGKEKEFISTLMTCRYHVKFGQHYEPTVFICPKCGTLKVNINKGN